MFVPDHSSSPPAADQVQGLGPAAEALPLKAAGSNGYSSSAGQAETESRRTFEGVDSAARSATANRISTPVPATTYLDVLAQELGAQLQHDPQVVAFVEEGLLGEYFRS